MEEPQKPLPCHSTLLVHHGLGDLRMRGTVWPSVEWWAVRVAPCVFANIR